MPANPQLSGNLMSQSTALKTTALVSVTAAATALLIQACGGGAVAQSERAQSAASPADPMIGVWDVVVTVKDCSSGTPMFSFNTMATMHQGGTMSANGDTFGVWQRESNGTYSVNLQFYRTNGDGSFAGWQKAKATRTLSADGNSYTSVITRWQVDAQGNAGPTGCASESGRRAAW
jgi:hypothetical protein